MAARLPEVRGAIMSGYYLVLIITGAAMWGVPTPYPDAAQCEAAGRSFSEQRVSQRYHCLPAPIIGAESVNRQFKRDAWPALKCRVPEANVGPSGTMVCEP